MADAPLPAAVGAPTPAAEALPGVQLLPCALATVTSEGLLLAVNPALSALLGRDAALCCGGPFDALLSTAGAVIYQSYLMPLLRLHGHLQEFSISLKCADGQALEVLLYASSRHSGPQRVHDLVMVPIRQRRRVEEEMLRVKRAADESPGMIFQLLCLPDGSGHFPYVSEAVRALYGSTPQAARESADSVFGQVLADDRAALLQARDAAGASGTAWRASARVRCAGGGGSLAWHEFSASPRQLANGVTLWHGHVADVTQRRAMEQALADREAARQASQAKSEFLARVSHELRTPLNGILGFAHLLLSQQGDNLRDDQRRRLGIMQAAGQGLLHLINDVLDITSIEMGQLSLHLGTLPLAPAVDAALAVVEPQAQAAGVHLSRGDLAGLVVQADARRLQQVLVNLLSNAIKYNRPGGRVDVRARSEAPADPGHAMACIEVVDTGPGLTDAQQKALFQPFNRLGAEQGPVEGIGLGLVISRQLVQLMHGSIGVRSQPGQGSCFLVRLPLAAGTAPAQAAMPGGAGAGQPVPTRGRVLYVEDNAVNVLLMEAIVGLRPGVRMQVCIDGAAGLAAAVAAPPDLLLLDMQLPDGDGSTLLQRMRAHPALAAVPAVAVSAAARSDDLARARLAGFAAYWTKPLAVDEVLAGLDRLLATAAAPPPGQSPP